MSDNSEKFMCHDVTDLIGLKRGKFPLWTSCNGKYPNNVTFQTEKEPSKVNIMDYAASLLLEPRVEEFYLADDNPIKKMHFTWSFQNLLSNSGSLF
jgi:hypothetical protein